MPRDKKYIATSETQRLAPIKKTDRRDYDSTKAYIKAYEKNNFAFSPPQAKRVSIAVEEALKKMKFKKAWERDVDFDVAYKAISKAPMSSITARRR